MKYFTDAELVCKCGRLDCDAPKSVKPDLARLLDALREKVGHALFVNSGLRCSYWNERQGGKPNSEHLSGEGADLHAPTPQDADEILKTSYEVGIRRRGLGGNFVHIGVSKTLPQGVTWTY